MKREKKQATKRASRRVLTLGILVDLAPLLIMKYSGFFATSVNAVIARLGSGTRLPALNLLLPLGISFYTLQAIAYLVDIYRGKVQADRNPAKFMLFMSFFPQIVQGPIPRHSQLAHQLYEGHDFDYDRLCKGVQLMVWGLFKKLVVGERIAIAVDYLFANYQSYTGLIVFMGVAMYGIQVYADFSGGMDIVRGVSQMLGIELELNFNQPYFSSSVEEFWRRW
ncbi:MAG: MBOAT family protein, partial [Atopobiaceae bacterium]|nr:MBOAT family protein [Atopobiaceae bacterium]